MARLCTCCSSPHARELNLRLATGASVAAVSTEFGLGESSIRRHLANHFTAASLDVSETTDILDQLAAALEDMGRVRAAALAAGRGETAIKAAVASKGIASVFLDRLGVDDLDVTRFYRESEALGRAVARVTREHPRVGHAIAVELAQLAPESEMAEALEVVAVAAEQKRHEISR
jgi:hypothetical protein